MRYRLFRARVIACLSVVAVLAYVLIAWQVLKAHKIREQSSVSQSEQLVKTMEWHISHVVEIVDFSLINFTKVIRALPPEQAVTEKTMQSIMAGRGDGFGSEFWFTILNADGYGIATSLTTPVTGNNYRDRDYYQAHASADHDVGLLVGRPILERVAKKPVFLMSRRLEDANGKFIGVVAAYLDAQHLSDAFSQALFSNAVSLSFFHSDGPLVANASSANAKFGQNIAGYELLSQEELQREVLSRSDVLLPQSEIKPFFLYKKIQKWPFVLAVGKSLSAEKNEFTSDVFTGVAGSLLITLFLFFSGRFVLYAYERMTQSEQRYRRLYSSIQDGMVLFNHSGSILIECNDEFLKIIGCTKEQASSKSFEEFIPKKWRNLVADTQADQCKVFAYSDRFERTYRCDDGSVKRIEIRLWVISEEGPHVLVGGLVSDVTERRNSELALQASEARFSSIFEQISTGILIFNPNGQLTEVNKSFSDIVGYPMEMLVGKRFSEFIHPDDVSAESILFDEVLVGKRNYYRSEFRFITHTNNVIWADVAVTVVKNSGGVILGVAALVVDITDRKQAQQALVASEKFVRNVTDMLPCLTGYWDKDLICRFANKPYTEWFSLERDKIVGRHYIDLLGEPLYLRNIRRLEGVLRGELQSFEISLTAPDGRVRHSIAHYIPDLHNGVVQGFFVWLADVTDIKAAQMAVEELNLRLEKTTAEAQAASQAKSDFLANMSHEIRTPMNGLMGMAQLLKLTGLNGEQLEYANVILTSAQSLLAIINSILDFSKIEAGKMEVEKIPYQPAVVIKEIADVLGSVACEQVIKLKVSVGPDAPDYVTGDPNRLRQILFNLVGNAIKFTHKGEVLVQLASKRVYEDTVLLCFTVKDTGIGMNQATIDRLFSPFVQGDNSTTRRFGGTGLGLTIADRLVGLLGGSRLRVSSTEGVGTTFYFELLSQVVAPPSLPQVAVNLIQGSDTSASRSPTSSGTVLVVEDNLVNRKVVQAMLEKNGYVVHLAEQGKLAYDAITNGLKPDLILMDCQMPVMDGFEATQAIRAWEASKHQLGTPIIALTAGAFVEDRERCLAAGMNDFLTKPIDVQALLTAIKKYTHTDMLNPPNNSEAPDPSSNPSEQLVFDLKDLLRRCDDDEGLAREILEIFLLDHQSTSNMLSDALSRGSAQDVRLYAHSLKGSAGNVGARSVAELARSIELAAASGDLSGVGELFALLTSSIQAFVLEAEAFRGVSG